MRNKLGHKGKHVGMQHRLNACHLEFNYHSGLFKHGAG